MTMTQQPCQPPHSAQHTEQRIHTHGVTAWRRHPRGNADERGFHDQSSDVHKRSGTVLRHVVRDGKVRKGDYEADSGSCDGVRGEVGA